MTKPIRLASQLDVTSRGANHVGRAAHSRGFVIADLFSFCRVATVRYSTGQEEPDQNGEPSIAPEDAAWFETDERDV